MAGEEEPDLSAVALMVGLRFFDRSTLEGVFREELLVLKQEPHSSLATDQTAALVWPLQSEGVFLVRP